MNNGLFIVIDGTDGSGKATQTELLLQKLGQLTGKVKKIDFPQYTKNTFGILLHEALKEGKHGDFIAISPKIASTLYAADRFETSGQIRQWLDEGYIVVADRYVSANQIHQGGKIKDDEERREFLKWLDHVEYGIFKIPRPDVIVYLHVPLEVSLELIRSRAADNGEKPDQAESDAVHLFQSQQSALKIIEEDNAWIKIDCASGGVMKSREDIHQSIFAGLRSRFNFDKTP